LKNSAVVRAGGVQESAACQTARISGGVAGSAITAGGNDVPDGGGSRHINLRVIEKVKAFSPELQVNLFQG
jgi:hypothetical protein